MEPKKRKEATSIAERAISWLTDKLGITEAPTYTDGYGVERQLEVPFNESAQGQELKRMGETAKNVGKLGLVAAGMINPFTAGSTTSALLGTLGNAYGLSLGAQNVYNTGKQFVQDPSSVSNMQLVSAGLDAIPFVSGTKNIINKLPKFQIPESIKNIDWKSLQYELDPRYMRVYHATEKPFDIQHFYTGTVNDSGLHTSKKPLSGFGDVLYKLYIKKPSFRFYDTWTNGAQMFNPAYSIKTTDQYDNTPGMRMLLDKAKVKYQIGDGFFGPSTIRPTENIDLNLAKIIFPKNPQLQSVLSDLAIKQKSMLNFGRVLPGTEQKVTDINKQVSNILSKNGYDVGVYRNVNSYETTDDTYSIFNNDAIKHIIRIKRRGGKINENNTNRN